MPTAAAIALGFLFAAAAYQWAGTRVDRRRFPAPGKFLNVDGCALHLHCTGEGSPTVVLEAGIAASSVGWVLVQEAIADFARVCAYDRPGFAWSSRSGCARTVDQFLREVRAVVEESGKPVVLVGHSFGGLLVRLYASRYPDEVLGLVLVDPALVCEWANPSSQRLAMLRRGISLSRRGALLARLGVVRLGLTLAAAGAKPMAKLVARLSSGEGGSATTQRIAAQVSKLPRAVLPIVKAHWCRPECFESMAEHLAALPSVAAEVERCHPLGSMPVIVISGSHLSKQQLEEHESLARCSQRGRHIVAERSGHWVHLDEPALIVDAVRHIIQDHHR